MILFMMTIMIMFLIMLIMLLVREFEYVRNNV